MKSRPPKKPVKIVLVGDNYLFRLSLKKQLAEIPGFDILGDTESSGALQLIEQEQPSIVVLDTSMSIFRGLRLLSRICDLAPLARIIALNFNENPRCLYRAFKNGCRGFVFKSESLSELENAIRVVGRGKTFISPRLASGFIRHLLKMADREGSSRPIPEKRGNGQALTNAGTKTKQENTMIDKKELCEKITSIYPDIGVCGIDIDVEFDSNKDAWVVDLKKDNHQLKTHLESEEAQLCLDGKQCVSLGLQISQLIDNIKKL